MGKKNRGQITDNRKQKKGKWKVPFKIPRFLIPKDEPITPRAFALLDYAGGVLVFFICWVVYLHTLTPTIGFHDSGDMITAAYVLGIPHPTGYPLYCLLGKLWMSLLPIGNIAYRMNLASALCASLACMMVYFIVLKVGTGLVHAGLANQSNAQTRGLSLHQLIPAAVAAFMLAFATTFWEQAVIAEKYSLNALFATLLIFILLKWAEAMSTEYRARSMEVKAQSSRLKAQRYLYLFAFTLGLSFTHHMQTIYLVPASVFFILLISITSWMKKKTHVKAKKTIRQNNKQFLFNILYLLKSIYKKLLILRPVLIMFFLFIIPLLLYSYLPLRASQNPPVNCSDPDNLERFIDHISAKDYRDIFVSPILKERLQRGKFHISLFFSHQFTNYFIWIGIVGMLILFFKKIKIFIFLILIVIMNITLATIYSIPNIEDYYIPTFVIFAILSGCAIKWITEKIISFFTIKKIPIFFFIIVYLVSMIFLILFLFNTNYSYTNKHKYYLAYDYGRNILNDLEEESIIFLHTDMNIFPSFYIQIVEKIKTNICFVISTFLHCDWYGAQIKEKHPDLEFELYPKERIMKLKSNKRTELTQVRFDELIENNLNKYPCYILFNEEITHLASNYPLVLQGLLWRIAKDKKEVDKLSNVILNRKLRLNLRGIYDDIIYTDGMNFNIEWTKFTLQNYAAVYNNWGVLYYKKGMYDESINYFKKAITLNPTLSSAYLNIGDTYEEKKEYNKAIIYYRKVISLDTNSEEAYNKIGEIYLLKEKYRESICILQKAIKLNPKNVKTLYTLCKAYYKNGDINNTCKTLEKLLELVPFRDDIRQALLAIRHGQEIVWD
ncbi:MAG: DUF2723 domain-containing protein [bacterium]